MAFCKYCGSSVPDKAEFCPECGKKVSVPIVSAQSVTTDDVPSRRDFFSVMGSPDAKKRIRRNWTALVVVIALRTLICLAAIPLYGVPFSMALSWIPRRIFNSLSLAHLLLLLSCALHRRSLVAAAILIGVYAYWPFWNIFDVVGCIADLVAGILVLVNTNKLEKEYQSYLGQSFPGSGKKK